MFNINMFHTINFINVLINILSNTIVSQYIFELYNKGALESIDKY